MKHALVVGASGQDGTLLAKALKQRGYSVTGVSRGSPSKWVDDAITLDVRDAVGLCKLIRRAQPSEIYYLAAYHRSSQGEGLSGAEAEASRTFDVNLNSYVAVLEAALQAEQRPRIFYACTSLIFAGAGEGALTEDSAPRPACLYSMSKLAGRQVSEHFRAQEGLHVSVGILFNHESALRQEQFLSRRIVDGIRAIACGETQQLVVGDLNALCDWGYAGDYVDAMWRMLQQEQSDTYIVASGGLHSVQDWVTSCCELAGIDPDGIVKEDAGLLIRKRPVLRGDSSRLRSATGWSPATTFEHMVRKMYLGEI